MSRNKEMSRTIANIVYREAYNGLPQSIGLSFDTDETAEDQ
ncbi:unnamed protein product [Brassica oleracea var. botrytis]|uniref:Uncharacterized protein n=2 Tax=Brassica TaxID=3705 RepID=A0A3P6BS73_BRAOL|nr:unnamed protein product [Brassica napus]VDD08573.1 unnamed protein product [Brassica oleracea]